MRGAASGGRSVLWIATPSLLAILGLPRVVSASNFEVRLNPGDTLQGTSPVFLSHDTESSKAEGSAGARLSAKTSAFAAAP
jgi:hypothetical protein